MLIVDAHLDLGMNALGWDRDLTLHAATIRAQEGDLAGPGRALGTVALPELRQGRVAVCVATSVARCTGTPVAGVDFRSPAQAFGAARGQFAYYHALERMGEARILKDPSSFDRHAAGWHEWEGSGCGDPPPLGLVLSMESADPILSPEELPEWRDLGIRLIGPAHYGPGRYAGGTGVEGGLTELGNELLAGMAELGIALDISHLSDQAFWEALQRFGGPVIASHNNCRALVPHQRQLDDDQLKALFERDAVIGAAADDWMLEPGWSKRRSSNAGVGLQRVCDHIDHVCQLAGNSLHAGIGSDLDGGYGRDQSPCDVDTIADLQKLTGMLKARGYGDQDVARIMHGNWLRALRAVLAT